MGSYERALDLAQEGKAAEACSALESLSSEFKQREPIFALRIRLWMKVDLEKATILLDEFRKLYHDDPTAVFATFNMSVARDNLDGAANLIDDVYKVVSGDEFLLWYKANLLALQGKYSAAVTLLTDMAARYKVDVVSQANRRLGNRLLASKEYKSWFKQQQALSSEKQHGK